MNLSKKLGIDMGSSSMVVYVKGDGVVLNEPSLIATDEHGMRVLALGTAALQMVRRGDGAVTALRPVRDGDVIDQRVAGLALQHFVARVCGRAAVSVADDAVLEVDGSDGEGRPQRVRISGGEVRATLAESLEAIAAGLGQLIQEAPEQARESVQRTGVTLTDSRACSGAS